LKTKELGNVKQEMNEIFQKDIEKMMLEFSDAKVQLAQTKEALMDMEDYAESYKEQIGNLQ
jgi:hypothetical protein